MRKQIAQWQREKRNKAEKEKRSRTRQEKKERKARADFGHASTDPISDAGLALSTMQMLQGFGGDWQNFADPMYGSVSALIKSFNLQSTVARLACCLTVPNHHRGTLRLEMLISLIVMHSKGIDDACANDLRQWLEDDLASLSLRRMEDPLEDIFISNVITPAGNYRLFEGVWESSDRSLQSVIDAVAAMSWSAHKSAIIPAITSLLALSDAIPSRANLKRWTISDLADPADRFLVRRCSLV